ncbi:hypothetical protein IAD21_00218 [Abditibacteriota bacterium]|nr:hypothetical protein IAD21_00218 [Abditibacteriota bacterium]
MTIGDVLAMIAGVTAFCFSVWSLLLGGTLLFTGCAATARTRLEETPLHTLGTGFLLLAVGGVVGLVLIGQPNGLLKLFGWVLLLGLLALGALGGTGIVLLAGERVRELDAKISAFEARRRGAALLVVAAFVPLLGWFLVAPLLIISSLGAGWYSFLRRNQTTVGSKTTVAIETAHPESSHAGQQVSTLEASL